MQAIVAVDKNWGIGYRGQLLVRIPADMKYFRQMTLGKVVVMGKETFLSLPGRAPLPERINIVLSEVREMGRKDLIVCTSLDELWQQLRSYPADEVFVIGGANVYAQLLPYCRAAYVTKIDCECPADRFFPDLDQAAGWEMVEEGPAQAHQVLQFRFTRYENKAWLDPEQKQ